LGCFRHAALLPASVSSNNDVNQPMHNAFKTHPKHPGHRRAHPWEQEAGAPPGGRHLHGEAVLKMFYPAFNVRAISARRRVTANPWFTSAGRYPVTPWTRYGPRRGQ